MKNKDFTLAFKLYTDGDLYINNYDTIDKDLINWVDYETYSLVKTWDNFDYAKEESLRILNSIYDNLLGRDYNLKPIKNNIKRMIDRLEKLSLEGLLKLNYSQSLYNSYESNQRLDIEFIYGTPDYEFREFNLLERLEKYITTIPDGDIKDSLVNLSMGRDYNNGVIKTPIIIPNTDLPSMEFEQNINLDKLIKYFIETTPDELRQTLKEYGIEFTEEDK